MKLILAPVRIGFLTLTLTLFSCSSAPKAPEEVPAGPPAINYDEIQNRLGLDIAPGQTGFQEKRFDACGLGEALNHLKEPPADCRQAYFTLIKFQLSCR